MTDVEELVRRHQCTNASDYPALRASGVVDLELLRDGALHHPKARVRRWCVMLLDHLDGDDAAPVFVQVLESDPVPRVRRHALHALICTGCKEAPLCTDVVPALLRCAESDDNAGVRAAAREALRTFRHDPRVAAQMPQSRRTSRTTSSA